MHRLLTLLFVLFSNAIFCQSFKDTFRFKEKLILSVEQNIKWLDSLQKLPSNKQIQFVVDRVVMDTNIYLKHSFPDGLKIDYSEIDKNKIEGCCKPLIVIESPVWITFSFDDKYNFQKGATLAQTFLNVIKQIHVDEVEVMPNDRALALYGTNALNGTLLLKMTDKKSIQLLKKLYHHRKKTN